MSAAVPQFDPVIHAPTRLQITSILSAVSEAEFGFVRDQVKVSDSVLSKHLAQLEDAGYVRLRKASLDGRQRTWLSLTKDGRRAFVAHVKALEQLVQAADRAAAE